MTQEAEPPRTPQLRALPLELEHEQLQRQEDKRELRPMDEMGDAQPPPQTPLHQQAKRKRPRSRDDGSGRKVMRRLSYSAAEKLDIIRCAEATTQGHAAHVHGVHKSMISRWMRIRGKIKAAKPSTRRIGSGRKPYKNTFGSGADPDGEADGEPAADRVRRPPRNGRRRRDDDNSDCDETNSQDSAIGWGSDGWTRSAGSSHPSQSSPPLAFHRCSRGSAPTSPSVSAARRRLLERVHDTAGSSGETHMWPFEGDVNTPAPNLSAALMNSQFEPVNLPVTTPVTMETPQEMAPCTPAHAPPLNVSHLFLQMAFDMQQHMGHPQPTGSSVGATLPLFHLRQLLPVASNSACDSGSSDLGSSREDSAAGVSPAYEVVRDRSSTPERLFESCDDESRSDDASHDFENSSNDHENTRTSPRALAGRKNSVSMANGLGLGLGRLAYAFPIQPIPPP